MSEQPSPEATPSPEEIHRYSPGKCLGARKQRAIGSPDEDHISTSFAERQNLNIRMQNRRFTRLTNAHSKSAAHHAAMVALFVAYYNFCRKHESCGDGKQTPAMVAGLSDHVWTIRELLDAASN